VCCEVYFSDNDYVIACFLFASGFWDDDDDALSWKSTASAQKEALCCCCCSLRNGTALDKSHGLLYGLLKLIFFPCRLLSSIIALDLIVQFVLHCTALHHQTEQ